ncbi:uncharacterized protein LOC115072083 [Nannospalax galili]|uniref:uncharacterized protein LOC115072083 n=1 Tax=Nannospalax galili TaxID=1026970 RepID=UPI00111C8FF1|nr:uncharacterized protein LOC115072083 [Nannospalax galili]
MLPEAPRGQGRTWPAALLHPRTSAASAATFPPSPLSRSTGPHAFPRLCSAATWGRTERLPPGVRGVRGPRPSVRSRAVPQRPSLPRPLPTQPPQPPSLLARCPAAQVPTPSRAFVLPRPGAGRSGSGRALGPGRPRRTRTAEHASVCGMRKGRGWEPWCLDRICVDARPGVAPGYWKVKTQPCRSAARRGPRLRPGGARGLPAGRGPGRRWWPAQIEGIWRTAVRSSSR